VENQVVVHENIATAMPHIHESVILVSGRLTEGATMLTTGDEAFNACVEVLRSDAFRQMASAHKNIHMQLTEICRTLESLQKVSGNKEIDQDQKKSLLRSGKRDVIHGTSDMFFFAHDLEELMYPYVIQIQQNMRNDARCVLWTEADALFIPGDMYHGRDVTERIERPYGSHLYHNKRHVMNAPVY
jgi:hypothetical protein